MFETDVAIIGAGAAGLAAAIFARREDPRRRVILLDGARRPGAKILVSGGSRCNVTNTIVTERDFNGATAPFVRRVLRGFQVAETIDFFAGLGVSLREEPGGKLFPVSNRSRDVLDALLRAVASAGAELHAGRRVLDVRTRDGGFAIDTSDGQLTARTVVLATGGLALPKTGSDGAGYGFARALGHTIVPPTPALVPLCLEAPALAVAQTISGVSVDAELALWIDGAIGARISGPLLWTHFGISGPAALDASRHWLRARLDGQAVSVTASFRPGLGFEAVDREWIDLAADRPRLQIDSALASSLPSSMAGALLRSVGVDGAEPLAQLSRDSRRRIVRALTEWPLPTTGSRGYSYAEVTAGGVAASEIDAATMASRVCPGLFLIGEIVDVDGRLGGFNFQWAWSSARAAARALPRLS